ncbi:MAG: cytochrome c3 family protein [Desulfobacterales bacterium]|uniref:Cytochrome c3 family protein n=1 Tax=Candidatus Desulfatibia vada TaxID=2841696 RepID=A0A8J6TQQ8_9BACT|nr:cytochrome c3 family protein [Candidatus Desulfatibia vada]MBL6972211.1 cytochrome c3 family protein [Desulfobacterales bacterium]
MSKKFLIVAMVAGIAVLFVAAGLYAGTEVKDEIPMNNKAYEKHEESILVFTHKKHMTDYAEKHPDLYANGCGECHHEDKDGKSVPLKDLKEGDEVKNCIECHKKPAFIDTKESKKKKLKKEDLVKEYHANAIHENCQGCHKKYNKKMNLKSKDEGYAPTKAKCKTCHPKK